MELLEFRSDEVDFDNRYRGVLVKAWDLSSDSEFQLESAQRSPKR